MISTEVEQQEQKKGWVRRHPVLTPIIAFVIIAVVLSTLKTLFEEPVIGVVKVEGVILNSGETIKKIRFLENTPNLKGMIIRINSPGGAVSPSQEIYNELVRVSQKIPVYASISSVAASGGYYIAIGTNRIFANPGSITGSIGVIMQSFNVEKLMNKIGIDAVTVKSGRNKDIGSAFRQMSKEERQLLQGVITDTHEQFVDAIAQRRNLEKKGVMRLADGRIFTGRQALAENLIDGLAGFYDTVDRLAADLKIQDSYHLVYPPKPEEMLLRHLDIIDSLLKLKTKVTSNSLIYYLSPLLD